MSRSIVIPLVLLTSLLLAPAARAVNPAGGLGAGDGIDRQALTLAAVGIVVVFAVLSLIAGVVALIRRLDDDWQAREQRQDDAALEREPVLDETTAVIIAAACATVIAGRFRVRRIRRLLSPRQKRTPWSAQGRLILQGSHDVGRKQNRGTP
jgi:Na+-transporting methylmalonyl-CoA/oxaloacetate decarboxylase gamma subunit